MTSELLEEVVRAIPMPALMVDQTERIVAANAEARTLLGRTINDRHFATILRQPQVIEAIEKSLRTKGPATARHLANDGAQDTAFEMHCRYMNGVGAVSGGAVLATFQDVTHLEEVSQMRRDFVANVSHELRTPLTALMGFIETLRGPAKNDPAAQDRFLEIMTAEANRMNRLVGDLLSLNRVESQERVRPRQQLEVNELIHATLNSLRPLADDAGVALSLSAPDGEVMLAGDGDQLRQVFTNLIENAIKYGGSGGTVDVLVTVSDRDAAIRGPAVRVRVVDKGPGIAPVHLPRLTERFYRADSHRSRQLGGTGLGLAIVKHIVNRHRGRLRVESNLGEGAVFTVILPR